MKKFTYLLAVAAVFTACNSGNNGYTVTGTIEGAADGDTVYLQTVEGRQLVNSIPQSSPTGLSLSRVRRTLPPTVTSLIILPERKV